MTRHLSGEQQHFLMEKDIESDVWLLILFYIVVEEGRRLLSRIRDHSRFGLFQTVLVSVRNVLPNTICLNSQECCLLFRMEKCSIFGHGSFSEKKEIY